MSYDPKIGRFVSVDPIAFEGGDTNLFRYVGNNPANFTDPDGLQGKVVRPIKVVREGENVPLKPLSYPLIALPMGPMFDKGKVYGSKPLKPIQLPGVADPYLDIGVGAGRYKVVKGIPPGRTAGPGAADTCIGLIITNHNKTVHIYHFYPTQSPMTTLESTGIFLNGSHAAICGGDNSPASNKTLLILLDYLRNNPDITIDGYSNTDGLYIGADGKYYTYKTTQPSEDRSGK